MGLDAEVIDGLLGHGEAGSETYGAHSMRVMERDLEHARAKVEALTAELQVRSPTPWAVGQIHSEAKLTRPVLDGSRPFGTEARRQRRIKAHERATVKALDDIQRALNGRSPETLTGDQWEAIGRSMLLREDHMPQPFASLRYSVYEDYLNRLWHERGTRPRMRRRFTIPAAAQPVIDELAVRVIDLVSALRSEFDTVVSRIGGDAIDAKLSRTLALTDICLNAQVADPALLKSNMQQPNLVPVQYKGQWFVEAFQGPKWSDGMPLRRFAVTGRSIEWLLAGSQAQRAMLKPTPIPTQLSGFAARCGRELETVPQLLERLAAIINQYNTLSMTGFEAAVLSGRVKISALPHSDLVRTTEQAALSTPFDVDKAEPHLPTESSLVDDWDSPSAGTQRSAEACRDLMTGIGKVLSSTTERGAKAVEIEQLLKASSFTNGDLPFALGRWIVHLLDRTAKTHSDKLQPSTIERYFDALASKVTAVGYAAHLVDMDSEELTELYYELLTAPSLRSVTRERKKPGKPAAKAEPNAQPTERIEGDGYAAARLVEFHEFIAVLHGLEDPDWSELGEFSDMPSGRPGVLTTREYLAILNSLVGERALRATPEHLIECAWVLLLGFRFGLRGGEAVGLHRADWLDRAGTNVVLVRPNSTRGLKTVKSKRVVPLMEALTEVERSIVQETMRRCDERPDPLSKQALLAQLGAQTFKYRRLQIVGRLLRLVKLATVKNSAILHHARHSFANRAYAMLRGDASGLGSEGQVDVAQTESARRLLLGRLDLDRRTLWALCRLMGHSSPQTLIRSYIHLQVAPPTLRSPSAVQQSPSRFGIINLDEAKRRSDYLKNLPEVAEHEGSTLPSPTLSMLFNYLRLRRIGRSTVNAAYVIGVDPAFAEQLDNTLTKCATRLEKSNSNDRELQSGLDLIGRITLRRFGHLIEIAGKRVASSAPLVRFESIPSTVGKSRQVVLFGAGHLLAMRSFVDALQLTGKDLILLRPKSLADAFDMEIRKLQLHKFASKPQATGADQQIDVAEIHRPGDLSPTTYKQRVALKIVGDKSALASGYELITAWCCHCLLLLRQEPAQELT